MQTTLDKHTWQHEWCQIVLPSERWIEDGILPLVTQTAVAIWCYRYCAGKFSVHPQWGVGFSETHDAVLYKLTWN